MRVLLTGCSGHVGGAIGERLQAEGHEVVGLSRRLHRRCRALSGAVALDIAQPGLTHALRGQAPCQAIVHTAAALPGAPAQELVATNCFGTQQLLELAQHWGSECFVFCSSVPVVGPPGEAPLSEADPPRPPTLYHATKVFGEHLVALGAPRPVILRLSSPVGPGMGPGRVLAVFVERALAGAPLEVAGQGSRAQDYVDVRDVAGAVVAALERVVSGIFNIASGHAVSNLELAHRCVAALASAAAVELGGRPDPEEGVSWRVSVERAARELGWRPEHSLESSIRAVAAR